MKFVQLLESAGFDIGDTVYLKTDPDQSERLVTGLRVRENGVIYDIAFGINESLHYAFELSKTRDLLKTMSN